MDDVRSYLADLDKSTLVEMLMEQAMEDDRLRRRLLMEAAKTSRKGLNVATYRQANGASANQLDFVIGVNDVAVQARVGDVMSGGEQRQRRHRSFDGDRTVLFVRVRRCGRAPSLLPGTRPEVTAASEGLCTWTLAGQPREEPVLTYFSWLSTSRRRVQAESSVPER